jgi:predicted phosphodiesterase
MPRIALISDIHANLTALDAVLQDIHAQRVDAIYCLGDVVGYGPQPTEAIDRIRSVCAPGRVVLGNHDHAAIHLPQGYGAYAHQALIWTNRKIRPGLLSRMTGTSARWDWLGSLPTSFTEDDVLFTHASPRDHTNGYILEAHTHERSYIDEDATSTLDENFALIAHTCFIGHTHLPGIITGDVHQWYSPTGLGSRWTIDQRKTIINVGSVGQPRDGDPRACYAIFDKESVEWRRIDYDIEKSRSLIYNNDSLANFLGDRLLQGR